MTKQQRQEALAKHVARVNDIMHALIVDLTEAIDGTETDECCLLDEILLTAYTFRSEVIDKHPSSTPKSNIKFPYDIRLAKELFDKIDKAQELAPSVVSEYYLNYWNREH